MADYQSFEYISQVGEEVRDLLYQDDDCIPWFDAAVEEFNQDEYFSEETRKHLLDFLQKVNNPDLYNRFTKIVYDDECADNEQLLYHQIFFGNEEGQYLEEEQEANVDLTFEEEEEPPSTDVLSPELLEKQQNDLVKRLSTTFCFSEDVSFLLLQHFSWNYSNVSTKLCENREKCFEEIHVPLSMAQSSLRLKKVPGEIECEICYCDSDCGYELICGHRYCLDCWKEHIMNSIQSGNQVIKCMSQGCPQQIMESDILEYCGPEVCKNFKHFLMEDQILRDSELLPCTNPGCQQVLTINCVGPCNVAECSCGKRICWRCHADSHAPLDCEQIEVWKNLSVMWEKKVKAQAIWEARELALVTHRAKHRDEIQRQNQIQNKELEQHHKELSNEELKEINELEKQIAQHKKDKTYSEEKLEIEQYQLNSLRRTHEVKEKERMKERETVKSEQQSILSMLNDPKHAPFYFRQFLESRQIRALQNVEMTSEELLAKITKKCPKCKSPIEKQGGCNYMRCGKCHYEFCWVCGDSWATHGDHFACNKFDGKLQFGNNEFDIKEQDIDLKDKKYYPPPMNELDRIEYNRFNFYHSRYSGHIQSQKLEKKAREKTLKEVISNLTDMSEKTATEFMKTVFKAIDDARSVLIWSYPKAYLMDNKTDNFHMFEIYQSNMEIAIEKLVGMVERASNKPTYEQYVKFRDMLIKYTNILLNETDMLANHKTRQEYQRKYLE